MSRKPRRLHGDIARNSTVRGTWSASSPDVMGGPQSATWDCHVTLDGRTDRFDHTMNVDLSDIEVMANVIAVAAAIREVR